jgi:hypothetical protein
MDEEEGGKAAKRVQSTLIPRSSPGHRAGTAKSPEKNTLWVRHREASAVCDRGEQVASAIIRLENRRPDCLATNEWHPRFARLERGPGGPLHEWVAGTRRPNHKPPAVLVKAGKARVNLRSGSPSLP